MSIKIKSVEEFNDDINSLIGKRNNLILEAEKINKDLFKIVEERNEIDPRMVKVKCLQCGGKGYQETEDGKKTMCQLCGGPDKPYIWVELHK